SVNGPPEGVVKRTWLSTTKTGPDVKRVPGGSPQAWATFVLAAQPTTSPVEAYWYDPHGHLLGTSPKSNRPTIKTGIGGTIEKGTWRVDLMAGGKVVKRVNVPVGPGRRPAPQC